MTAKILRKNVVIDKWFVIMYLVEFELLMPYRDRNSRKVVKKGILVNLVFN